MVGRGGVWRVELIQPEIVFLTNSDEADDIGLEEIPDSHGI